MATEKSWILLLQLKQLFYGHYTGQPQPLLPSTPAEDFTKAKSYSPHALADGNNSIWIRVKPREFFSVVL